MGVDKDESPSAAAAELRRLAGDSLQAKRAESHPPGTGARSESETLVAPEPQLSGTTTPGSEGERIPHILLAEDDPTNRKVISIMLRQANYTIDFAEDGLAAVAMWEKGEYDLVLMDVQMPRLTGFEATSAIREKERERGGHTPIVALTAHSYKEDEEKCRACGMDAHVAKPIDFKRCIEVMQGLLNRGSIG